MRQPELGGLQHDASADVDKAQFAPGLQGVDGVAYLGASNQGREKVFHVLLRHGLYAVNVFRN